jgi:hypothetical protein
MSTTIIANNPYITKKYQIEEPIEDIREMIKNAQSNQEKFLILTEKNTGNIITISPKNWASIEIS